MTCNPNKETAMHPCPPVSTEQLRQAAEDFATLLVRRLAVAPSSVLADAREEAQAADRLRQCAHEVVSEHGGMYSSTVIAAAIDAVIERLDCLRADVFSALARELERLGACRCDVPNLPPLPDEA
jgi:hypothetical protein